MRGLTKLKYTFALMLVAIVQLQSQNEADNLEALLSQTQNDTSYVKILNKLSNIYRLSDPIIAIDYAIKAEKIAQSCNYNHGLAVAYQNIGNIYTDKGNYEFALENYKRSYKIYQLLNNKKHLITISENIGFAYRCLGQFEKALEYYYKSQQISRELNDSTLLAFSYENLGLVYSDQDKLDKALIQFYNSLRLKEALNNKEGMANSYHDIGVIYFKFENIDQALVNFERSLKLFESTANKKGIAKSLLYLGEIYHYQQNYNKAIKALNRCLQINTQNENIEGLANVNLKIGKLHASIGNSPKAYNNYISSLTYFKKLQNNKGIVHAKLALAKNYYNLFDFENAKAQLNEILKLAINHKYLKEEHEITMLFANIYIQQQNYYNATKMLLRANLLSDSLIVMGFNKKISQLQMQNEFDKKMQQKEMETVRQLTTHQLKLQKINMLRNVLIIVLFLILVFALVINKKSLDNKKKNQIVEHQKNQIQIQQSKLKEQKIALETANQTKDKFISIISHDLRNPFNAINSFISLVTEQPEEADSDAFKKYLFLIKYAVVNAMSLLDNLLDWSKVQSGELKAQKEEVSINHILHGNVLLIKEIAEQKNIELIEELSSKQRVFVDKNMINAVIRNLLSNALKFTPENGKIWIKTIAKNDEIKVIVQDTGVGISENQLNNLLEPDVIKLGLDGLASSGLGLILCKEFLMLHKQELRVDSKVDYGTTFWFYLPLVY